MSLPRPLILVQLKTKVPLMPLGVAWVRHWLPQGHSIQGQPLQQVFAKPQGDLHFCLSFHQHMAYSSTAEPGLVNCRISPEGLPSPS